ncbi:aminotransferase class IV [Rubrobacter aplysinae]|uniref:aminotransferase class IV n=1 Tax=Rubrobacter aplysinae TaxID=909625 RepID=UPI00069D2174|nr:aminotransferase class IV [Rubrobacter aplysinae]
MSFDLVWLDGGYVPASEARVSVFDRGLAYGDGAFTTLRVGGGEPLLLGRHLERLRRDLGALYIPPPAHELEPACRGLVQRLGLLDAVLKITVTRGPGGRGPAPPGEPEPTAFVTASPLPGPRPPLRAVTVPDERGPLGRHKSLNYLDSVLALRGARAHGYDEAVFAGGGTLAEATVSNLVGLESSSEGGSEGGSLRTPGGSVLPGIARGVLLESGEVVEDAIPLHTSSPLYCVNAVRGVETVAELDGRPLKRDAGAESRLTAVLRERGALPSPHAAG